MVKLTNKCRIKLHPTLPTTEVVESLNFLAFMMSPFTGIKADSTGVYYQETTTSSSTDEAGNTITNTSYNYQQVYDKETDTWAMPEFRDLILPEPCEISEASWIAQNLWTKPTMSYSTQFTVNGTTFNAAPSTTWLVWLKSTRTNEMFYTTPDNLVAYGGCLLSCNGKDVNMYDLIIPNASYSADPLVAVNIKVSGKAKFNLLFTRRGYNGYLLKSNRTYTIPFTCDTHYHAIPVVETALTDYLSYQVANDRLIIKTGIIPSDILDESFDITVQIARKRYDKLTDVTQTVALNDHTYTLKELAPQYKVNVIGNYYKDAGNGDSVESEMVQTEGKLVHGWITSSMIFTYFASMSGKALPITFLNMDLSALTSGSLDNLDTGAIGSILGGGTGIVMDCANKNYILPDWFTEYMNQELFSEDVLGRMYLSAVYDVDLIRRAYVTEWATKDSYEDVEEYVSAKLAPAAESAGVTLEEYVDAKIEEAYGMPIDLQRYCEMSFIDETVLDELNDLSARNPAIYDLIPSELGAMAGEALGGMSLVMQTLYTMETNTNPVKVSFRYIPPSFEKIFFLQNNGEDITESCVTSDTAEFNIESLYPDSSMTLDGKYYTISSYEPPANRYTPGTITISEGQDEVECHSGDTMIEMADGSYKRIDAIQLGDIVKTINGPEKVIYTDSDLNKVGKCYTDYYFDNSTALRIIKDHRVYNPKRHKYVHISELKIGDEIVANDGSRAKLIVKETVNEPINHYCLFTEKCSGYYANSVLCGSCFSNIKPIWLRKILIKLYMNFVYFIERR